jgi:hypothetical protein
MARRGLRWIEDEIGTLDPRADSSRMYLLTLNRFALRHPMFSGLFYAYGFMRIAGQVEGAIAVDRAGKGLVHRAADGRADGTLKYLGEWVHEGPRSEAGRRSLARVKAIHDRYARRYAMSNETHVHTIALFTTQFERLMALVGASGFSDRERVAQVEHWRQVGEQLGVQDMPETWEGMVAAQDAYERSEHFRPTPEGHRLAVAFVDHFAARWFPRGLRWLGRWVLLSLHEEHVLRVLALAPPPRRAAHAIRTVLRAGIFVKTRVLPDRRELLDLRELTGRHGAPGPAGAA